MRWPLPRGVLAAGVRASSRRTWPAAAKHTADVPGVGGDEADELLPHRSVVGRLEYDRRRLLAGTDGHWLARDAGRQVLRLDADRVVEAVVAEDEDVHPMMAAAAHDGAVGLRLRRRHRD